MTNFERIAQDSCLPDEVAPNLVDGFLIGSHGMTLGAAWDAGGMTSRLCYDFLTSVFLQDWIQPLWLPGCQLPG